LRPPATEGFPVETSPSHRVYLQQRDFLGYIPPGMNNEQADILSCYGCWMLALALGDIAPSSPEQEQFLRCVLLIFKLGSGRR
jgi:hypothetical protein